MRHLTFLSIFLFLGGTVFAEAQVGKSAAAADGIAPSGKSDSAAADNLKKNPSIAEVSASSTLNKDFYEENSGEKFAKLVWETVTKTNTLAKSVGDSLADYVREEQLRSRQQELLDQFYISCRETMQPMRLSVQDARELLERVEQVYIEDGEKGLNRLDVRTFRDLPNVIRKEYGEMTLARARDGMIVTYYPGGTVKTRWQYKNGRPEGPVITYYENGEILYIDYYQNGDKISRRKYDPEGKLEFEQGYQYGPVSNKTADSPAKNEVGGVSAAETAESGDSG